MITQVDYKTVVVGVMTPEKRTTNSLAWNFALVSGTSNEHNILFNNYKQGAIVPIWVAGTLYNMWDIVKYGTSVYQSTIGNNTSEPSFDDNWYLVTDNFVGTDERILYTGEKLTLEYALNKWFGTVFRQPPLVSDIYLTTNLKDDPTFLVGYLDNESSLVGFDATTATEYITNQYLSQLSFANLTIFVPIIVYNALGTNDTNRTNVVRKFADKYVNAGITYKVQSY